jgi:hypothetical protein
MNTNRVIINLHTGKPVTPDELDAARKRAKRQPEPPAPHTVTLANVAARLDYQARKAQPTQNIHGVHVGDIFYTTWGYEQTNVEFFQVVELKGKQTAIIREIHAEITRHTAYMSGEKRPLRDNWASDKMHTVRTRLCKYWQGNPVVIRHPGNMDLDMMRTSDGVDHSFTSYY